MIGLQAAVLGCQVIILGLEVWIIHIQRKTLAVLTNA